ncbi:MAG: metallophosphoesterase [Myxococcota bacterium]
MGWVVVLLVIIGLVGVVAFCGVLARPLEQRSPRAGRWLRRASRTAWGIAALGGLCLSYALLIEADWLEVSQVRVESARLPAGTRYDIAVVSDLHVDRDTRALIALRDELTDRPADLVVFTGDAINRREAAQLFRATMVSLSARLGRAAVRGRHDVVRWRDVELFSGVATELLSDRPLLVGDGQLALCGAPWGSTELVEDCLSAAPEDALTVFAYHSPELIETLQHRPDLYVAGHTHGGQIRLPFFGALLTFSQQDKKYEAGRYEVKGTTLVVSRGIGFEPGFPRLRFLCRPEVVRIEVVGTGPARPSP